MEIISYIDNYNKIFWRKFQVFMITGAFLNYNKLKKSVLTKMNLI